MTPSNVSAATSSTGTNVNWDENGTATSWEILNLPSSAAPPTATSTGVIVTTNPYILTGLSQGTSYRMYIRSICSNNEVSDWSVGYNFINTTICSVSTQLVVNNITTTGAECIWSNIIGAASYEYAV